MKQDLTLEYDSDNETELDGDMEAVGDNINVSGC
jgi:hypothetical protein